MARAFVRLPRRLAIWLAALLAALAACRPAPTFDAAGLRTISAVAVIQAATARDRILYLERGEARASRLAAIAAEPAEVRALIWLAVLDGMLTLPTDYPPSIVTDGSFKDEMADALAAAGMAERARLFRTALARIEPPHPDDDAAQGLGRTDVVNLGEAFGHKAAFQFDMARWASSNPVAAAWCARQRAALSDEDRLRALEEALAYQPGYATAAGMAGWPEPYRVIALADIYQAESNNGSIHQFFLNSSGDVAPQARDAMLRLGLKAHAEAIGKGMAFFPAPYPADRDRRLRSFQKPWGEWDDRLGALTVDDGAIDPALIAYAKRFDILPR